MMHGWSPLSMPVGSSGANVIMVDTTQHLTAVSISSGSPATVTAQTGVTMDTLLADLEAAGYGLTATPAPGDLTLGGVLAIDGHGTALPAIGENRVNGTTYGSVSNNILSLTAVVFNGSQYVLQTFNRNQAGIQPLLAHLGRSFIVSATLQVGTNQHLRCQSWYNVAASNLFGPPGSSSSFQSYVDGHGRAEAIWFPFTSDPWLKVWSVAPSQPWFTNHVTSPYNYPFSDNISQQESQLLSQIVAGDTSLTPSFGGLQLTIVESGLVVDGVWDIWGWSKNSLLYVKPTTLRVTANGYAVLCNRGSIQQVINDFYVFYSNLLAGYQHQGVYPMNGPVEIRVTGLDQPGEVAMSGALSPQLSALRPRPDMPSYNCAVWFDILTVPGTPFSDEFYQNVEAWMYGHYVDPYACVRVEWSKGWGYTNSGATGSAWSNPTVMGTTIPNSLTVGQASGDNWAAALHTLDSYDPHRIFSNSFLDTLMP
jgi:FAD/FMN-containing dehydrogenase